MVKTARVSELKSRNEPSENFSWRLRVDVVGRFTGEYVAGSSDLRHSVSQQRHVHLAVQVCLTFLPGKTPRAPQSSRPHW